MAKLSHVSVGRRTFIVAGGAALIGAGTYAYLKKLGYEVDPDPTPLDRSPRSKSASLTHAPFDPIALGILGALVDHLIPGDDDAGLPSGRAAGVVDYLIAAARAPGLRPVRDEILKLTRLLDLVAKKQEGGAFAELPVEAQGRVVAEAAAGRHERRTFKPARAMEATLRLGLEGYLGHPHHGGNRDAAVWDALAIDMPRDRSPVGHQGG